MNLGENLAYVALVTNDVAAASTVFEEYLGLRRTNCDAGQGEKVPVFAVGKSALALFPTGHPLVDGQDKPGVHHVAFAVDDPDAAIEHAKRAGISVVAEAGNGLHGHRYRALDPKTTSGVRVRLSTPLDLEPSRSPYLDRLDHIGIASADNVGAIDQFCHKLGCVIESQQTDVEVETAMESFTSDKYGVVYHSRQPRLIGAIRVAFITAGDCELEFLQSANSELESVIDHGNPGNTRQDRNAIARFIAARGAGLHHIAFKTADINGVLKRLTDKGVRMIDQVGRPGSRRAQIGFVHPASVGGFLFHFVQRP
jgi:methylmalonyl-CoA epimerase